ncbi:MAG: ribosome biogenesis GTP-binding protein YihA/YsxC [Bacteroidota bacterium]|nr:ribosome biogenesis GTP-binding protein YihA/YsxC [Bacteroidota bacterium]
MEISSAVFVVSNTNLSACPAGNLPEYAFIGRSNVGKSTLINMLANNKELAKTSSKPGKTVLINHFLINNSWYIVDLPGYGYAKVSQQQRSSLHKMITDYVLKREQLACLFVLIDSRHQAHDIDLDFIDFLGESQVPFALIFTKTDKISQTEFSDNLKQFKQALMEHWEELPPIFSTASIKGRGRKELLDYIESINQSMISREV